MDPSFAVVVATIIWGFAGVLVKTIALPTAVIAAFRLGVPTIVTGLYLWWKKVHIWHKVTTLFVVASLLNAIRLYFDLKGLELLPVSVSVVLSYTSPIFVMVFSFFFLKEKITLRKIIILMCVLTGILVLVSGTDLSLSNVAFLGAACKILAAVIYAVSVILLKKESPHNDPFTLLFFQNVLGAIIFLPFFITASPFPTTFQISLSIFYAFFIGFVGFAFFFYAFKRLSVTTSALISYLEVVTAVLCGVIFLGESITLQLIFGGALIIVPLFFVHEKKPIAIQKTGSLK